VCSSDLSSRCSGMNRSPPKLLPSRAMHNYSSTKPARFTTKNLGRITVNTCSTQGSSPIRPHRYVLMTAAYNEELHIEKTITSVLQQTLLPERWMIVSDGSTDQTNEIIERYASQHDFIRFLRVTRAPGHSFSSKVVALNKGLVLIKGAPFDFIGNLDADVSVGPTYFEQLMKRFETSPRLGLASGFVNEEIEGEFCSRSSNRTDSVPHAAQLVRRACWEAIGGYASLKYGGEDWYAQTCAKMKGWEVEAIPQLKIFHHRHTGAGTNLMAHRFRLGRLDYSFGSDPLFEMFKCLRRIPERPLLIGGLTRLAGFAWSHIQGESREVSAEFIDFLRVEQKEKVVGLFSKIHTARSAAAPRLSDSGPL
jgi:poly-beta-1,6-N-acetyl-D-glucosamine synthase